METKNEQNISDILDSFVNITRTDKDVLSALVLIETKYDRIIHVKGGAKDLAISLYELCKEAPKIKYVMKGVLEALEEEDKTDESN